MTRNVNPRPQYLDSAGDPLISGKMFYFESGTDTLKTTFADINMSIPNANPVILTGDGRLPNVFFDGTARQKLTTAADVQIWDIDPVGGEDIGGNFEEWNPLIVYSTSAIVQASDDRFYISINAGNVNNDPTTTPTEWAEIEFINVWNAVVTYQIGNTVKGSNNLFFISLTADNIGNDPISDPVNWGVPFDGVAGPVSSTDNTFALWSGTTGRLLKDGPANSAVLLATTASFLTADETKLDGIEAFADVTDATNVAAAGGALTGNANTFTENQTIDKTGTSADMLLRSDKSSGDVGNLEFYGNNSAAEDTLYGFSQVTVVSATDGAEGGQYNISTIHSGASSDRLTLQGNQNSYKSDVHVWQDASGSTEHQRIDSAGTLTIDNSKANFLEIKGGTAGNPVTIRSRGEANSATTIRSSGAGDIILEYTAGGNEFLRGDGATGDIQAGADNTQTFGTAAKRWAEFFAGNATINTSDIRDKQDIADFSAAEKAAAADIKQAIKTYRWKDAVAAKGEAARIHVGVMAQDVIEIMTAHGLDAKRYSFFCYDEWKEKTIQRQTNQPLVRIDQAEETLIEIIDGVPTLTTKMVNVDVPQVVETPVVDKTGVPVMVVDEPADVNDAGEIVKSETYKQAIFGMPLFADTETGETTGTEPLFETVVVQEAGNRYGVRYSQLLAFVIGAG